MDFVGFDFFTQGGVHALVALDQTLALKLRRDQRGIPMTPIALDVQMLAGTGLRR